MTERKKAVGYLHDSRVAEAIAQFPERFGLRGFPEDVFRCSVTSSYVNDAGVVMIYVERLAPQRETFWLAHSKATVEELRCELVEFKVTHTIFTEE